MADKKRLGRGLHEISHLFISSQKEKRREAAVPVFTHRPMMRNPRSFGMISLTSHPAGPFLVSLAFSLSFYHAKVLLVDFKGSKPDFATLLGVSKLAPSIKDYLQIGDRPFMVQYSSLIRLLAFHLDASDLQSLPEHEKEILMEVLMREEFSSDFILINSPFQEESGQSHPFKFVQDLFILAFPNQSSLRETYRVVKQAVQSNHNLRIGIFYSGIEENEGVLKSFRQLAQGTEKFLGVSLTYLGVLPTPVKVTGLESNGKKGVQERIREGWVPDPLIQLGERIMKRGGFNPYMIQTPFFEKMISQPVG